jgi:hypothetical protein
MSGKHGHQRHIANGAMRSHFVVVLAPKFDLLAGIVKVHEPMPVQAFKAYPSRSALGANGLNESRNLMACQAFLTGALLLHIEVTDVSIGIHYEYFLHHRRRGRNSLRCRLFWTARLAIPAGTIVSITRATFSVKATDPDPTNWSMLNAIFSGILNPTEGGCHEAEAVFGGADCLCVEAG